MPIISPIIPRINPIIPSFFLFITFSSNYSVIAVIKAIILTKSPAPDSTTPATAIGANGVLHPIIETISPAVDINTSTLFKTSCPVLELSIQFPTSIAAFVTQLIALVTARTVHELTSTAAREPHFAARNSPLKYILSTKKSSSYNFFLVISKKIIACK